MFGKSLKKLTVAVFGTKKHRDTMFPPLFPLKVPSPPADKKFWARSPGDLRDKGAGWDGGGIFAAKKYEDCFDSPLHAAQRPP